MTSFPYDFVGDSGVKTIVAFNATASEPVFMANSLHPNFESIKAGLDAGDPGVWDLFNVVDSVMSRFVAITDRYSWNGHDILFDGDPIEGPLSQLLTRCLETGDVENLTAVAKFGENLAMNPNAHSREQAFGWLARYQFQITSEGYVVGYKGLCVESEGQYTSTWASQVDGKPSGFVNGQPIPPRQQIPQHVGDHVTLPRSEVRHDPSILCDRGLHVATEKYARGYGHAVGVVLVNPRDIVSVPGRGEKMRVCAYTFVSVDAESVPEAASAPVLSGSHVSGWQGDVGYRV